MKVYKNLEKILLIDDDDATNFYNRAIIEDLNLGVDIFSVFSGFEALRFLKCEEEYSGEQCFPQPGLILLDINMPGMDGWEFLEEYKKLPDHQKGKYVLAMLTTSENPDDKEKAKQFDIVKNYMHKPLEGEELISIIDKLYEKD